MDNLSAAVDPSSGPSVKASAVRWGFDSLDVITLQVWHSTSQPLFLLRPKSMSQKMVWAEDFFFFFCQYIFYKDGQIANRS